MRRCSTSTSTISRTSTTRSAITVGDELIRNVTLRLSHTLRGDDLVARLGGDEFAVITTDRGRSSTTLQRIAERIIAALCAPYSISGHTIVIGASIGIAVIDSALTATRRRHALRRHGALPRQERRPQPRLHLRRGDGRRPLARASCSRADLRDAIDNDELRLLYQPIVNASGETDGRRRGALPLESSERGEIPPAEFIPIAEHSGLIIELGKWVLRRACIDGKAWPGLTIAVNVSPLQFRRLDFVDMVERILTETEFRSGAARARADRKQLLGNVDTAETAMVRLKALGVRLALDDFGTGYSSLLYLRRFPFDKLKIDRSFVRSIEKAADAAAIVHAIVSLGRGLGMKVTAEGVETADQQLFLRAAGVHSMQGYRFGRPVSIAEISARLQAPGAFQPHEIPAALAS